VLICLPADLSTVASAKVEALAKVGGALAFDLQDLFRNPTRGVHDMLPGFLTTALEILIILDVCGAVVYFALSGLAKSKNPKPELGEMSFQPAYPSQLQPCAAGGVPTGMYSASPSPTPSEVGIYAGTEAPPVENGSTGLYAGFKHRISSLKDKFGYRAHAGTVEHVRLDKDHQRLGQVLDSFKEET
jgi:hypothetical protein